MGFESQIIYPWLCFMGDGFQCFEVSEVFAKNNQSDDCEINCADLGVGRYDSSFFWMTGMTLASLLCLLFALIMTASSAWSPIMEILLKSRKCTQWLFPYADQMRFSKRKYILTQISLILESFPLCIVMINLSLI